MTSNDCAVADMFVVPAEPIRLERAAAALRDRNYTVHIVDTVAAARALVRDLLPRDEEIFTAMSETLRLSGIGEDIDESGDYISVRTRLDELKDDPQAQRRAGAAPDVVIGSVHAVTEEGQLVVASATGSQLGPYSAGARRVIWVVGAQKVVADLDTALRRVRTYSLPLEYERVHPFGFESFVGKILILEREYFVDRATVILVGEPIGF